MAEAIEVTLPKGLVSIFDDEIGDDSSSLHKLRKALLDDGFACIEFSEPPQSVDTDALHSCSFHILDWQIVGSASTTVAVESIRRLLEVRPAPIFVLTNQNVEEVSEELAENDFDPAKHPLIWVKHKSVFLGGDGGLDHIRNTFNEWLETSASAKALVLWQRNLADASNRVTKDLILRSASWPIHLHKAIAEDGVNGGHGVGEILARLVVNAIKPLEFSPDNGGPLEAADREALEAADREALVAVLGAERYIDNNLLPATEIRCGDVFRVSKREGNAINITPDCDCISRDHDQDPKLLLLKVEFHTLEALKSKKLGTIGLYGDVVARAGNCIIPFVNGDEAMVVKLKSARLKKCSELHERRQGRLLSPYITHVLNQYVANVGRQAHIPIPLSLRPTDDAPESEALAATQSEN